MKCLSKTKDIIAPYDEVVNDDFTEGVVVQEGGSVDVGEGDQVPDDVGQDVSRRPHLHQVTLLV